MPSGLQRAEATFATNGGLVQYALREVSPGNYDVEVVLFTNTVILARTETSFELVKTGFEQQVGEIARDWAPLYGAATAALSGLSACAGIVLVPKEEPVLRQLAFVPLAPDKALAVLGGADGGVENRVIDLPPGVSAAALAEVGNYVSARLTGLTLSQAHARLTAGGAATPGR